MLEKRRLYLLAESNELENIHLLYIKPIVPAYALVTPDIVMKIEKDDAAITQSFIQLSSMLNVPKNRQHLLTNNFPKISVYLFCRRNRLLILGNAEQNFQKNASNAFIINFSHALEEFSSSNINFF